MAGVFAMRQAMNPVFAHRNSALHQLGNLVRFDTE